jgi:hypothetical protein
MINIINELFEVSGIDIAIIFDYSIIVSSNIKLSSIIRCIIRS